MRVFKKKRNYCALCNIKIINKKYCKDCSQVSNYIRDYGLLSLLQFIRGSKPSAPPYFQLEPNI